MRWSSRATATRSSCSSLRRFAHSQRRSPAGSCDSWVMRWLILVACAGCGFEPGAFAPDARDAAAPDVATTDHLRMIDLTNGQVIGGPHTDFPLLVSLSA